MTKACLWLACSLVLLAWPPRVTAETLMADEEGPEGATGDEDSLRPAIEVLSRRQRDLAGRQQPYGNYNAGLLRYHYEPTRRSGSDLDNLEFLSGGEDEGAGQPEDIGYGYQRGYGGGLGRDEGSLREQQAAAGARVLENLLREYLERSRMDEEEGGPGGAEEEEQGGEEGEKRSSAFRERGSEASKRGGRFVGPPQGAGSPFRERLIQELEGGGEDAGGGEDETPEDEDDDRRKRLLAVIKRLEEEEDGGEEEGEEGARGEDEGGDEEAEDERRRKRFRGGGEEDDTGPGADSKMAAYMELLENLWEKYEAEKAAEEYNNEEKGLEVKRGRNRGRKYSDGGPTFDHFNSPMGWMGGGGGGGFDGFGRRRRNGGHLRAYSSPLGRERGWFSDVEGPDGPQEAHRKRQFIRRSDERWDGEGAEDEDVGLSPEEWGAALEAGGGGGLILPSRQRRFPVAKRSSKRVLMPAGVEGERRKRRESGKEAKTDPKVAQALSQIFENGGGDKNNETKEATNKNKKKEMDEDNKMKKKAIPAEKKDEEKRKRKKALEDAAKATTEASEGKEDKKKAMLKAKKKRDGEGEVAAAVGEPETVKREKTEVKKSVDWSQYFGIDRRRKKNGNDQGEKEKGQGEGEGEEEDKKKKKKRDEGEGKEKEGEEEKLDDWLLNQYYKSLAMSTNIVKRGGGGGGLRSRRPHSGLVVEAEEVSGDEGGLDAMDGKLRRVEDAIVEEAIKDTGAHMGGPQGAAEGVRERVLSRLAAAYSLEKMRKALGEFKASLREDEEEGEDEGGNGGAEHPMMPSEMERERRRGGSHEGAAAEGTFVGPPLAPAMSEGYMGGGRAPSIESNEVSGGECPALERLATNCQGIGDLAGDYQHLFLDLCNWHEVCYICGSSASSSGVSSCDITFLREVDSLCHGHEGCRQSGRRMAVALRALRGRGGKHLHQHQSKSASVCWQHPCLADYLARRRRR